MREAKRRACFWKMLLGELRLEKQAEGNLRLLPILDKMSDDKSQGE